MPTAITIDASSSAGISFATFISDYLAGLGEGAYKFYGGTPDNLFGSIQYVNGDQIAFNYKEGGVETADRIVLGGEDLAYDWIHYGPTYPHALSGQADSLTFGQWVDGVTTAEEGTGAAGLLTGLAEQLKITGLGIDVAPGAGSPNDIMTLYNALLASDAAAIYEYLDQFAQHFIGSSGDDTYAGTSFDDTIEGGDGSDTAVFSGNRTDYTVTDNGDGTWTVADDRTSGEIDGADTLSGVEFAQFADEAVALESAGDPPAATDDAASTVKDLSKVIDVLGNDTDADGTLDPASVAIVDGPAHGTVTVNTATGAITYKPTTGHVGADTFTYTVADTDGNVSNVATVTLDVAAAHILTAGDDVFSGDSLGLRFSGIEVHGGDGHDYIVTSNSAAHPDTIYGGDGNDLIFTGGGNDTVDAGDGDDVIHARAGTDAVAGGAGDDTFVVRFTDAGTTTISDDDGALWHGTFRPATYPASWSPAPGATSGYGIAGEASFVSEGMWSLAVVDNTGATIDLTLAWTGGDLTLTRDGFAQTVVIEDYVSGTFGITLEEPPAPEARGTITLDASGSAGIDLEAFIRGGFLDDVTGGGMPVFDNDTTFSGPTPFDGEEMFLGFGTDAASKYVLAHGSLGYFFTTHTVWGEIGTIEYGARGGGAFDSNGYFSGGDVALRITGLDFANAKPANGAESVPIEATGEVHNFAVGHMYGASADQARLDLYAEQLDQYAQHFIGSSGDDVFEGSQFDDTIEGGGGDDAFNGGAGDDAVVFAGARSSHTVVVNGDGTATVSSIADGWTTTLADVESARFDDKVVNLVDGTEEGTGQPPADLALSNAQVDEDAPAGTVVGTLSATDADGDPVTFSLAGGATSLFEVAGGELRVKAGLDFETAASHAVTVRATDTSGNTTDETFTVTVNDVDEAPEALALSDNLVAEDVAVGTVVGTLSATDPEGGALAYSLSSNPGGSFKIVGNTLQVATALDYETAKTHAVTVDVKDAAGNTTSKAVTIKVTNVDEAPVAQPLAVMTVAENSAIGTEVGTLAGTDPDGGAVTFSLSSNPGGYFAIDGDTLQVARVLDHEAAATRTVTVLVTDGAGKSTSTSVTVNVADVNEAPHSLALAGSSINESATVGSTVGILSAGDPDGDALGYSLTSNPGGFFKIVGDRLQVARPLDFETAASHTVTVEVTDADGLKTDKSFTIHVGDVVDLIVGTASKNVLTGGQGTDEIRGLGRNDKLYGMGGHDRLEGGDGDDLLTGGTGADTLIGGKGSDTASYKEAAEKVTVHLAKPAKNKGEAAGDSYRSIENVKGSDFGDRLLGNDGDNVFTGGKGDDSITGGKGADTLYGQGGADLFVFKSLADTTVAKAGRDVIADFSKQHDDRIDLSLIDARAGSKKNNAFVFIGEDAFSGAKGELRFDAGSKRTFVYGDVDGDGNADFAIQLTGGIALEKADFVL